jgi:hypothetical protein
MVRSGQPRKKMPEGGYGVISNTMPPPPEPPPVVVPD